MGVYIWETNETHNLPSEYQEVEWIASSNQQYIETGLSSNGSYFKADYKFQLLSTSSNSSGTTPFMWGPVDGGQLYQTINSARTNFQFGAGNNDIVLGSITINTDYTVVAEWNSGTLSTNINGTTATNSYSGGLSTHTIPIFGRWRSSSSGYDVFSSIKLYYFKMYTASNTLARDLVPCYRKSDDVIGMYDLVNDTFYTNSGTGIFTKGEDVPDIVEKELLNAYIGEYAEPTATLDVDFTTLSSLDGFTVSSNGGTQLNSNGLSWQISRSDRILDLYHDLPGSRTNAKKVTMTMELYGNHISWGLGQWFDLANANGDRGICGNISFNDNGSSYQGNSIYMLSGTELASRIQANPTGTYTYTIEVDLVTGEWSGGYTGPATFSGSGTLTSAQIDEIMQTTMIHVDIRGQQANYNWLRKLNVTIEY